MNTNENPAPPTSRSRANSKTKRKRHRVALDWEAHWAAVWFARLFPVPPVARVLAALASLGRAFG